MCGKTIEQNFVKVEKGGKMVNQEKQQIISSYNRRPSSPPEHYQCLVCVCETLTIIIDSWSWSGDCHHHQQQSDSMR